MINSSSSTPPTLRILYAEDNESDSFIFEYIINKIFNPIEVIHFQESIDLVHYLWQTGAFKYREKALRQHITFLDINMPRMDGFEVLEMIKSSKNPEVRKLPIFMISTSSQQEDIQKSKNLGALGYVIKSPSYEHMKKSLYDLIQTALEKGLVSWTLI